MTEEQKSLAWLSNILDVLLKECPWDSVQTTASLRYLTIEEVHELSEAIIADNHSEICKELGDLFMHLLFYCKLAEKEGHFTTADAIDCICGKLISRHPHISLPDREGTAQPAKCATTPRWEEVKMKEGRHSALEGVPQSLPSMVKAIRLQEKAAGVGFEFPDAASAHAKATEEYGEFLEALNQMKEKETTETRQWAEEELGDLLFALVKWARLEGLNADDALSKTNQKFQRRFSLVEQKVQSNGQHINQLSLDELTILWNEAKNNVNQQS